jgi:hypothetical protein
MRQGILIGLFCVIWAGSASAQPVLSYVGSVESGWTSNATDSVAGGADTFAVHRHQLTVVSGAGAVTLRGQIGLDHTAFTRMRHEDDLAVWAKVAADIALGDGLALRTGYSVTRSWTGDDLQLPGGAVPTLSEKLVQEGAVEAVATGTDQIARVGVTWQGITPGQTWFPGLALGPLRLSAAAGVTDLHAHWEKALSPDMAALLRINATVAAVSDADQAHYLRVPAQARQSAIGLRWKGSGAMVEAGLGVDVVWPSGRADLQKVLPGYALAFAMQPWPGADLTLSAESGIELADPVDGVAGRTEQLALELASLVSEDVTVFAQAGWSRETGLFVPGLWQWQKVAAIGVRRQLAPAALGSVTLSLARHGSPGAVYDKASLSIGIGNQL